MLSLKKQILEFDRMIMAWYRSNETSKRLHYIPGVGPLLATALVANVADPGAFRSGRNFSVIRYAKAHGSKHRPWLTALLARRPAKVAAIALANKLARMAWAMMAKGERYRNPVALAA